MPTLSTFRSTVSLHRAAVDRAEIEDNSWNYHYCENYDSFIKVQRGCRYADSAKVRGAIAWAIRKPGRQVTIWQDGKVDLG